MKSIAILGASGHGKVIADIAECCGFSSIVFFDDYSTGKVGPWHIVGNSVELNSKISHFDAIAVGIGNNLIRQKKILELKKNNANLPALIHPSAVISKYSSIGYGTIICAGAIISTCVSIGDGNIINTSSTVDHDCTLNNFVHVSPGAHLAGGVHVQDRAWIGIGATINQLIHIGSDAIIGANSAVIKNIPPSATAVGVPSKIIK
jgi:sugar O-acyltransferase (sialic acid O-acetyltransferase NeuD family)